MGWGGRGKNEPTLDLVPELIKTPYVHLYAPGLFVQRMTKTKGQMIGERRSILLQPSPSSDGGYVLAALEHLEKDT